MSYRKEYEKAFRKKPEKVRRLDALKLKLIQKMDTYGILMTKDDPREIIENIIIEARKEVIDIIKDYPNPYPKDIFLWDNKGKLDFSRGRFNEHCYKIVESMRSDLMKSIKEE